MRLPTKQLINKIETLSKDLSPQQLSNFLDIIDAMTALVEDAGDLKEHKSASSSKEMAVPVSIVH